MKHPRFLLYCLVALGVAVTVYGISAINEKRRIAAIDAQIDSIHRAEAWEKLHWTRADSVRDSTATSEAYADWQRKREDIQWNQQAAKATEDFQRLSKIDADCKAGRTTSGC